MTPRQLPPDDHVQGHLYSDFRISPTGEMSAVFLLTKEHRLSTAESHPTSVHAAMHHWLTQTLESISTQTLFKTLFCVTTDHFDCQGSGCKQRRKTTWRELRIDVIPDQDPWACQTWAWGSCSSVPSDHCCSCAPYCMLQGSPGGQTAAGERSCKERVMLLPNQFRLHSTDCHSFSKCSST